MPTLGDLKVRIIEETDRDDLGAAEALGRRLAECIDRAIEFYADEPFWFSRTIATTATVAGIALVNVPFPVRVAEAVSCRGEPLQKVSLSVIQQRPDTGAPRKWASVDDRIHLWPIPDAVHPLTVAGTARLDAPADDEDESVWTTHAYDLIAARTRFLLFRDVLRDTEGTQLAAQAEGEALLRLRRETRRRDVTPLRSAGDEPWTAITSFNVNTGD